MKRGTNFWKNFIDWLKLKKKKNVNTQQLHTKMAHNFTLLMQHPLLTTFGNLKNRFLLWLQIKRYHLKKALFSVKKKKENGTKFYGGAKFSNFSSILRTTVSQKRTFAKRWYLSYLPLERISACGFLFSGKFSLKHFRI